MASFVEQAVLLLDSDRAVANINRTNDALRRLFSTANKMRNMQINLRGVEKLQTASRALRDLNRLQAARPHSVPLVGSRDIQTLGAIERHAKDAAAAVELIGKDGPSAGLRAIHTMIREMRGDARGAQQALSGFGRNARSQTNPPVDRQAAQMQQQRNRPAAMDWSHWFRGATVYFTVNQAQIFARNAVLQGMERERAELATQVLTTPEQRRQIEQIRAGRQSQFTDTDFRRLISGFLADTGGNVKAAEALARRVEQSTSLIARARGQAFEDTQGEATNITKAVGQLTTEMTDSMGRLTERAEASFKTIEDVMRVQPDLTADTMKAAIAGLGAQRQVISQEDLFRVLFLAGDQGQRVGNQFLQAVQNLSGEQRKISNAALEQLGLRRDNQTVDQALLDSDTGAWIRKNLVPAIEQAETRREREIGREMTSGEERSFLLATLREVLGRQTSRAIVNEFVNSWEAMERARQQALSSRMTPEQDLAQRTNSWLTQLEVTTTRFNEMIGSAADSIGTALLPQLRNAGSVFEALNNFITKGDGEPSVARTGVVAGGAVAAGAGALFAGKKLLDFFNPLTGSAKALTGSAVALDRAAAALMRAAGVSGATGGRGDVGGSKVGRPSIFSFLTNLALAGKVISDFANLEVTKLPEGGAARDKAIADALTRQAESKKADEEFVRSIPLIGNSIADLNATVRSLMTPTKQPLNTAPMPVTVVSDQTKRDTIEMGKIMQLERQDALRAAGFGKVPENVGAGPSVENVIKQGSALIANAVNQAQGFVTDTLQTSSTTIQSAFGIGGTDAQTKVQQGLTQGAAQAAPTIATGLVTGAVSAAQMIQNAITSGGAALQAQISNAVANVRVNVTTTMPNGPAPANTGQTGGGL